MTQLNVLPGNDVLFIDENADERIAFRWDEGEDAVRIVNTQTGQTIGFHRPNGDFEVVGKVSAAEAALDKLTQAIDADGNDINNAGSLDTDSLSIAESGIIDHGTVSQDSTSFVTVSFSNTYNTEPIILHEVGTTDSFGPLNGFLRDVTTTDFISGVENIGSGDTTIDHASYAVLEP